ncbi:Hypothetical predicted protein [Paramuricea clavata]|uniref:Uncharacterized protein n=1 Tax=Paramuricea clavata TaxID=317549 RepID=A0A6S7HZH7_PARCT|nr:Hypothetical predicted protein [Paramuricea clavata]
MSGNMDTKEKLLRETEAMLRAVLISSPRGVRFEKLLRDYRELTFKTIPFKELGFPRLEHFLQSIPSVARVEKGPDGEWIVKGVASDADKHVAKLISKQKKPTLRKSAKSMFPKRRVMPRPPRMSTPVRKPPPRLAISRTTSKYVPPPRMQRLQETQNRNEWAHSGQRNMKPGKENAIGKSCVSGSLFRKATDDVKTSRSNEAKRRLSSSSSKETPKLSVSISNTSKERSVTAVTSPERPAASGVLEDVASVKWMKAEILKAQSGLWATRLEHLYKEKFKKVLPTSFIQELKFRPDIATVEEPIAGRYLLYAPRKPKPPPAPAQNSQQDTIQVNVNPDIALPCFFPEIGQSVIVYISHTENPSCFYVSREDAISEMLSEEILKHYKSTHHNSDAIPSVSPGQIFCAKFTEDGNFYRACVLEVVDHKNIKVQYVDFGNKEVIPVDRLRVLISEFQTQPVQAFECCLDGIDPANQAQEWSKAAVTKFDDLTSEKELKMTLHEVDGKVLSVSLVDVSSQLDIAEEMKKSGLAISSKNLESTPSSSSSSLSSSSGTALEKSPPRTENVAASRSRRLKSKSPGIVELPDDQFLDVLVCNITGTYNVYLRLVGEEYSTKFEGIQESMTCYYSDSKEAVTTEPVVDDLFALISEDVWCRVKVTGVNGEKIQVFFVDHGDETETTKAELRPLASQFRKLPFQVFQCALNGLPKTKNPDVVDKLEKLIMGEVAVAEIVKKTGDLVFIELLDTRTDANIVVNAVIRKLVIPDEELKPVLPKVGRTTDVDIAYISPTGSVFLHVSAAGSKRLDELNRDLTDHYLSKRSKANEFISKPTAGKVCCAKCEDDGNWYRAKILSFTDRDGVEVLYVDYGNTEIVPVTNLREPTQENAHVLSLPFQALECQLYDVPKDGWSDDIIDKIFEIVEQGSLAAEVLSDGDPPSISLLVTAESEGEQQVTHRLASYLGLAASEETQEYQDDDAQVVPETEQENADGEAGEHDGEAGEDDGEGGKGLVNGDKTGMNVETDVVGTENAESEVTVDIPRKLNVETDSAKQAATSEEKPEAVEEAGPVKVEDKIAVGEDGISKDTNGADVTEIKNTNSETGIDNLNNDGLNDTSAEQAGQCVQWKALPLQAGWFDVYITEVKDPDHFTFQLLDNDSEITKLAGELNEYYQNQAAENEVTLVKGNVYAVLYDKDDWWYRGFVESVITEEKAHVLFLDYGGYAIVERGDMRVLDEKFLELPFQGVPAKLAGVKCTKNKWSRQSVKDFRFFIFDQYLVARIKSGHTEYNSNPSSEVTVELCNTEDPTKDIYIAEKLIENNSDVVPLA